MVLGANRVEPTLHAPIATHAQRRDVVVQHAHCDAAGDRLPECREERFRLVVNRHDVKLDMDGTMGVSHSGGHRADRL